MVLDSLSKVGAENNIHKQSLSLALKERHGGADSLAVCDNSTHVNDGSIKIPRITIQARAGKSQSDATLEDMYNKQYSDDDNDNDWDWKPLLQWFCVNCTMDNLDNVFHCVACGEHRESGILKLGHFASPLFPDGVVNWNGSRVILETKGTQHQNVSTIVGFDERMLLHEEVKMKSHPHPERPDRLRAIAAGFATKGIFPGRCASLLAREITREELQMIHSSENIEAVELTSRMVESYFTPDTYANKHSALAARLAAGICADLASAIFTGKAKNGFALVRPPGHHAGVKLSSGFCLHNNAAVAASAAQQAGAKKVLIVDWDIHHGNGTQEIFDKSKSVLFVSLHRHEDGKFYPGTGAADEVGSMGAEGYCVNIPWSRHGVGDNDYIYAFQQVVIPIASEFAPDFTIISAGFDAARGDPFGCCDVTPAGFAQMTKMLSELSGGKLLVILEGGYNLRSISSSATAVIKVLLDEDHGFNSDEVVPSRSGLRTICECLKIQMKFWHILEPILSYLQSHWGAYAFENKDMRNPLRVAQLARKEKIVAERVTKLSTNQEEIPPLVKKIVELAESSPSKETVPALKRKSKKKSASKSQDRSSKRVRVGEFTLLDESDEEGVAGETIGEAAARIEKSLLPELVPDEAVTCPNARTTDGAELFQMVVPEGHIEGPPLGLRDLEEVVGRSLKQAVRDTFRLIQSHTEANEKRSDLARQLEASKDSAKEIAELKAKLADSEQLVTAAEKRVKAADVRVAELKKEAAANSMRADEEARRAEEAIKRADDLKAEYEANEAKNIAAYFSGGLRAAFRCVRYEYPNVIPLDRMAAYCGVDQFDMKVRTMHFTIPYNELELATLKKQDIGDGMTAEWPVPVLNPVNLDSEIQRRQDDLEDDELIDPEPASNT